MTTFMDLDYKSGEEDIIEEIPHKDSYTIEFKNVSYKYPEADGYAIKNFNLKIKAGEKLAVVGLNGAGKSTMIKLLLHLYDPTEGEILLDGVNIKKYRTKRKNELNYLIEQEEELKKAIKVEQAVVPEAVIKEKRVEVKKLVNSYGLSY